MFVILLDENQIGLGGTEEEAWENAYSKAESLKTIEAINQRAVCREMSGDDKQLRDDFFDSMRIAIFLAGSGMAY